MNAAAIDGIVAQVIASLTRGERAPIAALTLLVRRYAMTGSEEIGRVLEVALAHALDDRDDDPLLASPRLVLLTEAITISDDERLGLAITQLAERLRSAWPDRGPFAPAIASVEAFLVASPLFEDPADAPGIVTEAIDELERLLANAYEPGAGLARTPPVGRPGTDADHVVAARALLAAWQVTGRLPYAMLAEELMRAIRASLLSPAPSPQPLVPDLDIVCEAARVFCRLDALHADPDYRAAAVVAPGASYAVDAERLLRAVTPQAAACGPRAGIYALALEEWLARTV